MIEQGAPFWYREPDTVLPALAIIVMAYIGSAEIAKRWFFQREDRRPNVAGVPVSRLPKSLVDTPRSYPILLCSRDVENTGHRVQYGDAEE